MQELAKLWGEIGPEGRGFAWYTVAGVLGALATTALEHKPIVIPKMRRGALHLGFAGTLIVSLVAAHAVDHSFGTALVAAVCGGATIRRLKREIDRGFEGKEADS